MVKKLTLVLLALAVTTVMARADNIFAKTDSLVTNSDIVQTAVKGYNWVERTFNTYDTTYVAGENNDLYLRLFSSNWYANYRLNFHQGGFMNINSDIETSLGLSVAWKFIAVSYQQNLNKFFNRYEKEQRSFDLTLNSAILNFNFYIQNNHLASKISHFSTSSITYPTPIDFNGVNTYRWGFNLCYFFNNKKYSQSAAFSYTRFQKKSAGSFFVGLAMAKQRFTFDFGSLPADFTDNLPSSFQNNAYRANLTDFYATGGYAYNWVLSKHWMLAFSEAPLLGYRYGHINIYRQHHFCFANDLQLSAIYNFKRFFIGFQSELYSTLAHDPQVRLSETLISFQLCFGCHFGI